MTIDELATKIVEKCIGNIQNKKKFSGTKEKGGYMHQIILENAVREMIEEFIEKNKTSV